MVYKASVDGYLAFAYLGLSITTSSWVYKREKDEHVVRMRIEHSTAYDTAARAGRLGYPDMGWVESSVPTTNAGPVIESTKNKDKKAYFSSTIEGNGQDIGGVARVLSAVVCQ